MSQQWIGRTLSKVTIQELLGRGGMAEVYLGLHTTLNRPVAVKILHAHLAGDQQLIQRTHAEAQAVAALRHPNIVQVYDFDIVDDRPYIVMELLKGMTLADYLRGLHRAGQTLPYETVSRLVGGIAAALDYAHQRDIVHRDVKPANVMLRRGAASLRPDRPLPPDVEPILTDFGVARIAHSTTRTESGTVLGTPHYMSPEQVRGEKVDSRTDIYALGVMAYEMIAGTVPFVSESETPVSILLKQIQESPPPIPSATREIEAVVRRSLAKERADRFQTAGALASALSAALLGPGAAVPLPGQSAATAVARRGEEQSPLRRFAAIGIGLVAIVAIALAGSALLGGQAVAPPIEPTAAPTEAATPPTSAAPVVNPSPQPTVDTPTAEPVAPTEVVDVPKPSGSVTIAGSSLVAAIENIPDPASGSNYQAWLTAPAAIPLKLGVLTVQDGQATLEFDHPDGANLLGTYNRFVVSREPVPDADPNSIDAEFLSADVDSSITVRFKLLEDVTGGKDQVQAVLDGLQAQVGHYDSHRGFAVDAIGGGDFAAGKTHSEHLINIVEGRNGPEYGDWDSNQRVENPGDDVGLLPYLMLLRDLTRGPAQSGDEDARRLAADLNQALENLERAADDARKVAQQIALADSIRVVNDVGLAAQLGALRLTPQVQAAVELALQLRQVADLAVLIPISIVAP